MALHPWQCLIEPEHLLSDEAEPGALLTLARGNNIARMLGCPLMRRGELLAFLATVEPVEPATPQLGAVWRWLTVVDEMRSRAPHFIPEQYRDCKTPKIPKRLMAAVDP